MLQVPGGGDGIRRTQSFRTPKEKKKGRHKSTNSLYRTRSSSSGRDEGPQGFGKLSGTQIANLHKCWRHLYNNNLNKISQRILNRLGIKLPKTSDVFHKSFTLNAFGTDDSVKSSSLDGHVKLLAQMFEDVFVNLSNNEITSQYLNNLGAKHASLKPCGFTVDMWEEFGEIAVQVVTSIDGIQGNREHVKNCRLLLACVTDQLRVGYERQVRDSSKTSLNSRGSPVSPSAEFFTQEAP